MNKPFSEGVLQQRGAERGVVGADRQVIYLGFTGTIPPNKRDPQYLEPWTFAEACELRDWLNSVIPTQAQRQGNDHG